MGVALQFFRIIAACTSTMMILSPIPSIRKTLHDKNTGVGSIVPLVSMLTNCHIAMMFGYLCELYFPVFSTFVLGDILCLTYIVIFYRYSHEKPKAHRVFLLFGIPLLLITLYCILGGVGITNQKAYDVGQVAGYVGILATLILYSSPFEKVALVLKHRSGVFLNIHMVCAGTFNNSMWIVYGYLTRQWVIFSPNVFCCTMGCIQIGLYLLFHPSTHPYNGQIPGLVVANPTSTVDVSVELELGELALALSPRGSQNAMHKMQSPPCFVPLASPLEPPSQSK